MNIISAIGANRSVGNLLNKVAENWIEGAHMSKVQLQKLGLNIEDVDEIREQLLGYSQLYL